MGHIASTLAMFLGRYFTVELKSHRTLVGRLTVVDKRMNMCLDNCYELVRERGPECVNPWCSYCKTGMVHWGVAYVRGEEIRGMAQDDRPLFSASKGPEIHGGGGGSDLRIPGIEPDDGVAEPGTLECAEPLSVPQPVHEDEVPGAADEVV
jgi:small nuclear ribonucleoprotein (snRNP)-like protein